jgi:hypothetical protein
MLVIAGLALCSTAFAQNEKPKGPISPAVKEQPKGDKPTTPTMDDWSKANQMAPEHVEMAKNMVGDWNTQSSFWMDPKGQPQVSTGKAKFEPIMGARFISQEYTGKFSMPGADGKMVDRDFKGHGLYGFNTVSKEYENIWIDSTATGIMLSTGKKYANGDIVFTGQYDDPMSGQKKTAKSVMHHESRDKMVFTMYDKASDGTEVKSLEVVYTRATPMGKPDTKKDEKPAHPTSTTPDKKDDKKSGG